MYPIRGAPVPPNINSPQDMLLHDMREMLYVEQTLADQVLPQIAQEAQARQLCDGIEQHQRQTQDHVRNLERCFELMGAESRPEPSHAMDGMKQDHDQLVSNIQRQELRDLFDAESVAKTEHMEIAAYNAMIMMAQQMGQDEVHQLLRQNCDQDRQSLEQIERMAQQMGKQIAQTA
jgi:ferritin-like metal-binding protein YciE